MGSLNDDNDPDLPEHGPHAVPTREAPKVAPQAVPGPAIRLQCALCGDNIVHQCHTDLREALINLLSWTPDYVEPQVLEGIRAAGQVNGHGDDHDGDDRIEDSPFLGSQNWVFPMFDKDDARTFQGLLHTVLLAAGIDPRTIPTRWRKPIPPRTG